MKRLSLTIHVQQRRAAGNIPPDRLKFVMEHLITQHNMDLKDDGTYKFRKGGTQAIILKTDKKYRFITFFGPTGYVIDSDDIGDFNCVHQTPEYLEAKKRRSIINRMRVRKPRKQRATREPAKHMSRDIQQKLKRETFELLVLTPHQQQNLQKLYGQQPYHILLSKFDSYQFVEILDYSGKLITTLHKNKFVL